MKGLSFYTIMSRLLICTLFFPFIFLTSPMSSVLSAEAVVHAVLFYSPNCGHCQLVITESLPPLFEQYGEQLNIVSVDVTQPAGQVLFLAALQYFNLESGGVPFLVVGDTYLVGSVDIPEKFPGLIEQYLAQGGVDWPDIPGLAESLALAQDTQEATLTPTPILATAIPAVVIPLKDTLTPTPTPTPENLLLTGDVNASLWDRLAQDPLGNSLAIALLAAMLACVVWGGTFFRRASTALRTPPWGWLIPVLCIAGLGIAGYLAYVETTHVDAACGPVGDCNTVQQSEYARLFGILPIGVLGMAGYIMIIAAWFIGLCKKSRSADYAVLAMLAMTAFGTLFSIYLTFLEPFVIGATCAWCLTSAIIMTTLMLLSIAPGKLAVSKLMRKNR